MHVQIEGYYSSPNAGPDNINLKLKCGSTVIAAASLGPTQVQSGSQFILSIFFTAIGNGASGAFIGNSILTLESQPFLVTRVVGTHQTSTTPFDFTTACVFDATAQWAGAQASESFKATNVIAYLPGTGPQGASGPSGATGATGGGATSTLQLTDFLPTVATNTLTVQPGRLRFGISPCLSYTSPSTAGSFTGSGGTGIGKLYMASTCALVLQYPNSLTITSPALSGITAQPVTTPTVPSDAWYIADVNINTAAGITGVTDKRAIAGADSLKAGTGIVIDYTLGPGLASIDPAVVPTLGGTNPYTGTQDSTLATVSKPSRTVSSDPSGACANNNEVILSTSSGNLFSCLAGTWHAMGGGSSSSSLYLHTFSALPITISTDFVIDQTGLLPSLAAGACWGYEMYLVANTRANGTMKLWLGTAPGSSGDSISNTFSYLYELGELFRGTICNLASTQSQQNAYLFTDANQVSGGFGVVTPYATSWTRSTGTGGSLKIGISFNTSTGSELVNGTFRVWAVQ
jgi:hypothetical protein